MISIKVCYSSSLSYTHSTLIYLSEYKMTFFFPKSKIQKSHLENSTWFWKHCCLMLGLRETEIEVLNWYLFLAKVQSSLRLTAQWYYCSISNKPITFNSVTYWKTYILVPNATQVLIDKLSHNNHFYHHSYKIHKMEFSLKMDLIYLNLQYHQLKV